MTEEEKILSGILYAPGDPELKSIKLRTHKRSQDFNRLYEDQTGERNEILHEIFAEIGEGSVVTRDISSGCVAAGVPCRVIRRLSEEDSMKNRPEYYEGNTAPPGTFCTAAALRGNRMPDGKCRQKENTQMNVLEQIYEKAKLNPKTVAFPEAANEKMMQAAYEAANEGYINAVLVGDAKELEAIASERGYDPSIFRIIDIHEEDFRKKLIDAYVALPGTLLKEKALNRRMQDPLYYAMVMEAVGEADVTFAGIDNTTGDVLLAGQMVIGLKPGINTVSSIGLCDIPGFQGSEGQLLAIGDSAVCTNPDAEQMASIAISACDTVHELLGWEPRCAMASYSTLGSGQGELVDKVVEAVRIANEKRPDLAIDGEFQFDAAISPAVAAKKVKRASRVAGKANVVIWPDLNVGNVAVKLIQQFGHADAYGPMLQGFNKIVCDCSRGAPVSEIKGNIVISAVRAAGAEHAEGNAI